MCWSIERNFGVCAENWQESTKKNPCPKGGDSLESVFGHGAYLWKNFENCTMTQTYNVREELDGSPALPPDM